MLLFVCFLLKVETVLGMAQHALLTTRLGADGEEARVAWAVHKFVLRNATNLG